MTLPPLTVKVIDDLGAALQAAADRCEKQSAAAAALEEKIAALKARLEAAAVAHEKERAVLEACRALPESTLAFWRATRHIQGFDPAIAFIDAVVALRALEEKGDR